MRRQWATTEGSNRRLRAWHEAAWPNGGLPAQPGATGLSRGNWVPQGTAGLTSGDWPNQRQLASAGNDWPDITQLACQEAA